MSKNSMLSFASDSLTPDEVAMAFQKMPKLMETALKRQSTRFSSRIRQQLAVEPGAVKYPIQWTSEKQRRAFFATDGFGRGIGAPRSHALSRGWRVDISFSQLNAQISTYNTQDDERFVSGGNQQGFHANTGWQKSQPIIDKEHEQFVDTIRDTVFTVVDDFAGVR